MDFLASDDAAAALPYTIPHRVHQDAELDYLAAQHGQPYPGLPEGRHKGHVLAALKRAAPAIGLTITDIGYVDAIASMTSDADWTRSGPVGPLCYASVRRLAQALGVTDEGRRLVERRLAAKGLVVHLDDGTGRRCAERDDDNLIVSGTGLSLAPLVRRFAEFEHAAAAVEAERREAALWRRQYKAASKSLAGLIGRGLQRDADEPEAWKMLRTEYAATVERWADVVADEPSASDAKAAAEAMLTVLEKARNFWGLKAHSWGADQEKLDSTPDESEERSPTETRQTPPLHNYKPKPRREKTDSNNMAAAPQAPGQSAPPEPLSSKERLRPEALEAAAADPAVLVRACPALRDAVRTAGRDPEAVRSAEDLTAAAAAVLSGWSLNPRQIAAVAQRFGVIAVAFVAAAVASRDDVRSPTRYAGRLLDSALKGTLNWSEDWTRLRVAAGVATQHAANSPVLREKAAVEAVQEAASTLKRAVETVQDATAAAVEAPTADLAALAQANDRIKAVGQRASRETASKKPAWTATERDAVVAEAAQALAVVQGGTPEHHSAVLNAAIDAAQAIAASTLKRLTAGDRDSDSYAKRATEQARTALPAGDVRRLALAITGRLSERPFSFYLSRMAEWLEQADHAALVAAQRGSR